MIGHIAGTAVEVFLRIGCIKAIGLEGACTTLAWISHEGIVEPLVDHMSFSSVIGLALLSSTQKDSHSASSYINDLWAHLSLGRIGTGITSALLIQKITPFITSPSIYKEFIIGIFGTMALEKCWSDWTNSGESTTSPAIEEEASIASETPSPEEVY